MYRRISDFVETHLATIGYTIAAIGVALALLASNTAHNEAQQANQRSIQETKDRLKSDEDARIAEISRICEVQQATYVTLKDILDAILTFGPQARRFHDELSHRLELHRPECGVPLPGLPPPIPEILPTTTTTTIGKSSSNAGSIRDEPIRRVIVAPNTTPTTLFTPRLNPPIVPTTLPPVVKPQICLKKNGKPCKPKK